MTAQQLTNLTYFSRTAKKADFMIIFGDAMGEHLWRKFERMEADLLRLIRYLDNRNLALLAAHLSQEFHFTEA